VTEPKAATDVKQVETDGERSPKQVEADKDQFSPTIAEDKR
jgi:hypothetical protein